MFSYKNEYFSCKIDFQKGFIVSLTKKERELLAGEKLPLFEIALRDADGEQTRVNAFQAAYCTVESDDTEVRVVYGGLDGLTVTVYLTLDKNLSSLHWRIDIDNPTSRLIEWIDYPQVCVKNCLRYKGGDGQILWPYNEGVLVDDMALREASMLRYREPEYPSLGLFGMYPNMVQSQFLAFLFGNGGLYVGAHDPAFGVKNIDFRLCGDGIKLQLRTYACCPAGEPYVMNCEVVYRLFDGDWHDGAEIYRKWFEKNKSADFIPIEKNKNLPDWYGESPVIITYPVRGLHDMDEMNPNKLFPYMQAMPIVEQLSKTMDCKIMALLMHWEGSAPWAPPYVWPPFGGETVFKEFLEALHRTGNLLGVYCSGIGWTQQSNLIVDYNKEAEFEKNNLKDIMCSAPDGQLPLSNICTGQRSGYDFCPACEATVDILTNEILNLVDAGIDYVQVLDQNHGGNSYFCYSKNHGHPPAPGEWQVKASKRLLGMLKPDDSKILFGCESAAAEPFIPQLMLSDNRFELNYHMGTPVPLYSYIYHQYVNNFMGNQVGLNFISTPDNLFYRLGYSFAAGDLLTLVITDTGEIMQYWGSREFSILPDKEKTLEFIKNLNLWRVGAGKKYLHTGKMVKPFKVLCDGNKSFELENRNPLVVQRLLTSRFEASDKSTGQVIINYDEQDVSFSADIPEGLSVMVYQSPDGQDKYIYTGENIIIKGRTAVLLVSSERGGGQ